MLRRDPALALGAVLTALAGDPIVQLGAQVCQPFTGDPVGTAVPACDQPLALQALEDLERAVRHAPAFSIPALGIEDAVVVADQVDMPALGERVQRPLLFLRNVQE